MDAFLTERGRRLIGWDEILEGGLAPNATVMSWRGEEGGIAAATAGHDVVMAPEHLHLLRLLPVAGQGQRAAGHRRLSAAGDGVRLRAGPGGADAGGSAARAGRAGAALDRVHAGSSPGRIPNENQILFAVLLSVTAIFIPMAAPNVVATVYDVTPPEVRSTALSVQYFIESSGAALAPGIAGLIADQTSLKAAFLLICVTTWILCGGFFALVALVIPNDVRDLRQQMRQRAEQEKAAVA